MVAALLGVVIAIIIAVSFIAPIASQVSTVTNTTAGHTGQNVTGAANTLTGLMTLLFVAFVILTVYKMTIG